MRPFVDLPSRLRSLSTCLLVLFILAFAPLLHADSLAGTVHDPSGAVIPGAQVTITGGDLTEPLSLSTDGSGNFTTPDLKQGTYSLRVERTGFEPLVKSINLVGPVHLELSLEIAKAEVAITVTGKGAAYANSDPVYRQLRGLGIGDTYQFDHVTLNIDVGTFTFDHGTLTLLSPVEGVVSGAVFVGEGHFHL